MDLATRVRARVTFRGRQWGGENPHEEQGVVMAKGKPSKGTPRDKRLKRNRKRRK